MGEQSRIEPFPESQTAILNQLLCSLHLSKGGDRTTAGCVTRGFKSREIPPVLKCIIWQKRILHSMMMLHSKPVVFNSHICGWQLFNIQISGSQWLQSKGKGTALEKFVTQII